MKSGFLYIVFILGILLLFSGQSYGCGGGGYCPPCEDVDCPDCKRCKCGSCSENAAEGSACGTKWTCTKCDGDGSCVTSCEPSEECCEGDPEEVCTGWCCYNESEGETCCNNGCCCNRCQTCVDSNCVPKCDPNTEDCCPDTGNCCEFDKCESCDDEGNCVVCNGDTDKVCCDGGCVDKCHSAGEACEHDTPVATAGCQSQAPDNKTCFPDQVGQVCSWNLLYHHNFSAACPSCNPGCKTYDSCCASWKGDTCRDALFIGCVCDFGGPEEERPIACNGMRYICN